MANMHKEKQRCVRGIPQDLWDDFEKAATEAGTDRSALVHAFIRWYLRQPGAKPPKRPHDARSDNTPSSADKPKRSSK